MQAQTPDRQFLDSGRAQIETHTEHLDGTPTDVIAGYGLVFYDPADPAGTQFELRHGIVERFLPGCLDDALEGGDVRCLFNHDENWPLGRSRAGTMTLAVDKRGLKYATRLPDSPIGKSVGVAIARRDVTGSSIGMAVRPDGRTIREERGVIVREISRIELLDVGPVTFPAYTATSTQVAQRWADDYLREKREAAARSAVRQRRIRRWLFCARTG